MKIKKNILCLLILLFFWIQNCLADHAVKPPMAVSGVNQIADSIRPLKIGERMPDLSLDMIRYKNKNVRISSFRGKLLILDFWSIWCGGCINALPKLEKLQNQFPERLMVLPVSFTKTASQVEEFYRKQAGFGDPIGLPSAIYPTMKNDMLGLFPVPGFPLLVWISPEGKVLGMTDSFMATEENVRKILSGNMPQLPLSGLYRQTATTAESPKKVTGKEKTFSSSISPYDDALVSRTFKFRQDTSMLSIRFDNASIVSLFKASLYGNDTEDFRNKKLLVDFPDSAWMFDPRTDTAYYRNMAGNSLCYQLRAPSSMGKAKALNLMNQQLSAFLGLKASFEQREVDCLILGQIPGRKVEQSKGGKVWIEERKRRVEYIFHNRKLSELAQYIQDIPGCPLVIVGTDHDYMVDFVLELPTSQPMEKLNPSLSEIGLELRQEKRLVRMVVISRER